LDFHYRSAVQVKFWIWAEFLKH